MIEGLLSLEKQYFPTFKTKGKLSSAATKQAAFKKPEHITMMRKSRQTILKPPPLSGRLLPEQ